MRDPIVNGGTPVESVIPFTPTQRNSSQESGADQLDKAGQSILHLLHRAAGVAEENSRHALDTAQKLSHQLRAAEDRIAELEAEVARIRTELSVPSNGCTGSTQRLKTVSCSKRSAVTARGNVRNCARQSMRRPAANWPSSPKARNDQIGQGAGSDSSDSTALIAPNDPRDKQAIGEAGLWLV